MDCKHQKRFLGNLKLQENFSVKAYEAFVDDRAHSSLVTSPRPRIDDSGVGSGDYQSYHLVLSCPLKIQEKSALSYL